MYMYVAGDKQIHKTFLAVATNKYYTIWFLTFYCKLFFVLGNFLKNALLGILRNEFLTLTK